MRFWEKALDQLSQREWEALCDGCGLCCLHKFEDEDTGEILYTNVACRLFDAQSRRCKDYTRRMQLIPECRPIRSFSDEQFAWLPKTCAYRLRHEGKPLPPWHPLISGDPLSVEQAGRSAKDCCVPESAVTHWADHIIGPI